MKSPVSVIPEYLFGNVLKKKKEEKERKKSLFLLLIISFPANSIYTKLVTLFNFSDALEPQILKCIF